MDFKKPVFFSVVFGQGLKSPKFGNHRCVERERADKPQHAQHRERRRRTSCYDVTVAEEKLHAQLSRKILSLEQSIDILSTSAFYFSWFLWWCVQFFNRFQRARMVESVILF
jgi:hypothetical protein